MKRPLNDSSSAAHEAAIHTAKLRVELSQSRTEQQDYLKNVELARVLDKRAQKKKEKGEELTFKFKDRPQKRGAEERPEPRKKPRTDNSDGAQLNTVLGSIF